MSQGWTVLFFSPSAISLRHEAEVRPPYHNMLGTLRLGHLLLGAKNRSDGLPSSCEETRA